MSTPLEQQLATLATQALAALNLVLVQARLTGSGKFLTVQVLLENPDGSAPAAEILTRASRLLGAQLDVADLIKSRYVLEVSSPGLDRPLLAAADYQRFVGRQAKLTFTHALPVPVGKVEDGKTQALGAVTGHILAADETSVSFALRDNAAHTVFALKEIRHAELVPSPEELALFMKRQPLPGDVLPAAFVADETTPELNA